MSIGDTDRAIIEATQAGLPLVPAPYAALAAELGLDEATVMSRFEAMKDSGVIRRIAAAPNHYKLGMTANGMTVWDVDDAALGKIGPKIGALPFVTHCYERPRALPDWPYNLFAMVHGHSQAEVRDKIGQIAQLLGDKVCQHEVLFSTRILKKTGLRIGG